MSAHVTHVESVSTSNARTHSSALSNAPAQLGASSDTLDVVTRRIARGAFALPFAVFGLFHFTGAQAMAGMVPVPGGVFWVYFTGAALLAGSIGILTGILGRWAALGTALLMGLFAFTVHLPNITDPQMGQMATISFLKDVSLLGAALTWAWIFSRKTA